MKKEKLKDVNKLMNQPIGSTCDDTVFKSKTLNNMKKEEIEKNIKELLKYLGFDMEDENYKRTPQRFLEVLESHTIALRKNTYQNYFNSIYPKHNGRENAYKGMIVQGPIRIYSMCSHHLLPTIYDIFFGYIPKNSKVVGFSKIARIIEEIAKRPMNQEDLTQEIVDVFKKNLEPKGMAVLIYGIHFCMKMRGIKSDAINMTSCLKGEFLNNEKTREEFFSIVKGHKICL